VVLVWSLALSRSSLPITASGPDPKKPSRLVA